MKLGCRCRTGNEIYKKYKVRCGRREANEIELPQVSNVEPNRASLESVKRLQRPDYHKAALTRIKPTVAASLVQAMQGVQVTKSQSSTNEIPIGESCKNGGCKKVYKL